MKTCTYCKHTLPLTSYSRGKSVCKPCASLVTQERNKTPEGVVNMMYSNQRMTSRKMGRPAPDYTLKELREWVFSQPNWKSLYTAWVTSGYDKHLKPSCDRINSGIPYTLSNLQLVTFTTNLTNRGAEAKKGLNLGNKGIPVKQLDMQGNFIQEFPSVLIAMRHLGKSTASSSNIHNVCKGTWKSAYGYIWQYA